MKAVLIFVIGVFALQSASAQCLSPIVTAAPIVQNSVGVTLADTLSLLTVSSLLADTLPFGYPCVAPAVAPYAPVATIAPVLNNCGCGGYGYPYGPYVL